VLGLEKVDRWNPIRTSAIQTRPRPHAISGLFQPRKGSSKVRNFELINCLQHVFEKWVERCKKRIVCQGRYFEKETVTAPAQSSDWLQENVAVGRNERALNFATCLAACKLSFPIFIPLHMGVATLCNVSTDLFMCLYE
jgi:hypothetical protein